MRSIEANLDLAFGALTVHTLQRLASQCNMSNNLALCLVALKKKIFKVFLYISIKIFDLLSGASFDVRSIYTTCVKVYQAMLFSKYLSFITVDFREKDFKVFLKNKSKNS